MIKRSIKNIPSSIIGEVNKTVFFFTNHILSQDKLNTKSNKNVFVKNTIMTNIIKHCRGEKKRYRGNRRIYKKTIYSRL